MESFYAILGVNELWRQVGERPVYTTSKCLLLPKYSPKEGRFGLWTILLPSGDPFRGHTRVPSDIAGNELAVHTDSLTRDAILDSLRLGDLLEAFVKEVHAFLLLILADLTAESIIRIYGWTLFIKSHHAKGTAIKQIESALLIQLLVTTTTSFFEYHHWDKNADGSIWTTDTIILSLCCIERFKNVFVNLGGYFLVNLLCQADSSSYIRPSRSHISPEGELNKLNCFVFGLFLNIFLYCCLRLQNYEKNLQTTKSQRTNEC